MVKRSKARSPSSIFNALLKDHTVFLPKTVVLGKRNVQFLCTLMSVKENDGYVVITRYVKPSSNMKVS